MGKRARQSSSMEWQPGIAPINGRKKKKNIKTWVLPGWVHPTYRSYNLYPPFITGFWAHLVRSLIIYITFVYFRRNTSGCEVTVTNSRKTATRMTWPSTNFVWKNRRSQGILGENLASQHIASRMRKTTELEKKTPTNPNENSNQHFLQKTGGET